jgi:metal-dependent hydrolase (beta-lactamase superfamily II)
MRKSSIARAFLSCILCLTTQVGLVSAQVNPAREETDIERIKNTLTDSAAHPKARVEARLKDKRRVTGYLAEMRDDDFILHETTSGDVVVIAYRDVATITNKNHSTFSKVGIAALVGGTALLTVVAIVAGSSGR